MFTQQKHLRLPFALIFASALLFLSPEIAIANDHMENDHGDQKLVYKVFRKGDNIGRHEVEFENEENGTLKVEIDTDVKVKLAFVTVYRFDHEGEEIWRDGKLVGYRSKTNDDGKKKTLQLSGTADTVTAEGSAGRFTFPQPVMPASLWNIATVEQTQLMNTLDGHMMAVSITRVGAETIRAGGQDIEAVHYVMTGELEREMWYAEDRLVHLRFKGSDGSTIDYELQ
jgi:hypothetical protein